MLAELPDLVGDLLAELASRADDQPDRPVLVPQRGLVKDMTCARVPSILPIIGPITDSDFPVCLNFKFSQN